MTTRILLVGDSHGNIGFIDQAFMHAEKNDCQQIIQLGDFGYGWVLSESSGEIVDKFSLEISKHIVERTGISFEWIDGNHENFDALYRIPVGDDGRREVSPGVFHLPRGHRFEIEGVKFLVCGGGVSVDKAWRNEFTSWWRQEAITEADIIACGDEHADIVLSHDVPIESSIYDQHQNDGWPVDAITDSNANRLAVSSIVAAVRPSWVFHGHTHEGHLEEVISFEARPELRYFIRGLGRDGDPLDQNTQIIEVSDGQMKLLDAEKRD